MFTYSSDPGRWVCLTPSQPGATYLLAWLSSLDIGHYEEGGYYIERQDHAAVLAHLRATAASGVPPEMQDALGIMIEILETTTPLDGQ